MTQASVKMKGVKKLRRKFNRLVRKVKNKRPLYKRIGIKLLNEISRTFETETHEGKRWKALSLATVMKRRKGKGEGRPRILQDTGTLRRSFVREVKRDYVRIHIDPAKKTIKEGKIVGTPIEYAPKHEFGEGVPKRPMLPSEKRALEIAIDVADKYVGENIKKTKL